MSEESAPLRIWVTAAHGGAGAGLPIGGGAAVIDQLLRRWSNRPDVQPILLGLGPAPHLPGIEVRPMPVGFAAEELVRLKESAYARLCRTFEAATTAHLLAHWRLGDVVLANDISEGPNFRRLAAAGIPIVTLWHVDVVDYFARFYLGGLRPERLTNLQRRLGPLAERLPSILELVFGKQAAAVAGSVRHIVPSAPMRDILERCYPGAGRRVDVVPWGGWSTPARPATDALVREYEIGDDAPVLLTLSRLSPEKAIERVLRALAVGESRGETPADLRLLIAGEAAFMQGERYRRRLEREVAKLSTRVDFVGYAGGERKAALFERADLYLFPSRHESYGLTLVEALRAGLPVVTTDHYSARSLVPPRVGEIVPQRPERDLPRRLWEAVRRWLQDDERRSAAGRAAREFGRTLDFDRAAERVLAICRLAARTCSETGPSPGSPRSHGETRRTAL